MYRVFQLQKWWQTQGSLQFVKEGQCTSTNKVDYSQGKNSTTNRHNIWEVSEIIFHLKNWDQENTSK